MSHEATNDLSNPHVSGKRPSLCVGEAGLRQPKEKKIEGARGLLWRPPMAHHGENLLLPP